MIKTIVIPLKNSVHLTIPNTYIGREVEILVYAKDEIEEKNVKSRKTLADFTGTLSETEYQELKTHTEQARKEWNRDI